MAAMIHCFLHALLCAVIAVALIAEPAAAQGDAPGGAQWEAFPLDPTPTASPDGTPTATPRESRTAASDGIGAPTLVALLIAATALGGIVARTAARRLPRRGRPAPAAAAGNGAAPEAAAPAVRARPSEAEARRPAPAVHTAQPATSSAAAPQPDTPPRPTRGRKRESRRAAAPPAKAPRAPAPERQPREPRRAPAPRAPAEEAPSAPAPPGTGRHAPSPPVPPRGEPPAEQAEACRIVLQTRAGRGGRFCAVDAQQRVLAYSAVFPLKQTGEGGMTPPEALRALVDELEAAGWQQRGRGRKPWELRFERRVPAARP